MSKQPEERPTLFKNLEHVVEGKIYRTEGSTVLARKTESILAGYREHYLMQTSKGSYFEQVHTFLNIAVIGQSQTDEIKPLTLEQAYKLYNQFEEKLVPLQEAFSGLEEA